MEHKIDLNEKIADAIWQIWRGWKTVSHPVRQGKITPEQYWILFLLFKFGPQRVKDIATRLGASSSSVTIAVKRLEKGNLVTRTRDTADERVVTVSLSNYGQEVFGNWRQDRRQALSAFFNSLNPEEKILLHSLLDKVLQQIQEGGV